MFMGCDFNQDLSTWDVSTVTNMGSMFGGSKFNQDISNWDVNQVESMSNMFGVDWDSNISSIFNQDLGSWEVDNVTQCGGFNEGNISWTLPKPNFNNCDPN